jgi:hypothetical protein
MFDLSSSFQFSFDPGSPRYFANQLGGNSGEKPTFPYFRFFEISVTPLKKEKRREEILLFADEKISN